MEQRRSKACGNLWPANSRWRALQDRLGFNLDSELAAVVLDRYLFITFMMRYVRYHVQAELEESFSSGED